nr:DUF2141 domain-containing protein [Sphingomonas vulcanisoli]
MAAAIASSPRLGVAEGTCRPNESGPAIRITVEGLSHRTGTLRAELYPVNDDDFLEDDNKLIAAGKAFRRSVAPVPAAGPVILCLRAPSPGAYALAVIHNPSGGHGFSLLRDGVGFAGNPYLGHAKPHAIEAAINVGQDVTPTLIVMNYRRGLFSFGPLGRR